LSGRWIALIAMRVSAVVPVAVVMASLSLDARAALVSLLGSPRPVTPDARVLRFPAAVGAAPLEKT